MFRLLFEDKQTHTHTDLDEYSVAAVCKNVTVTVTLLKICTHDHIKLLCSYGAKTNASRLTHNLKIASHYVENLENLDSFAFTCNIKE